MKNFRKAGIFAATILFVAVAVTFTACEKEDKLVTEDVVAEEAQDVYVKNGMLHFKDHDTFIQTREMLMEMTPSEKSNWEESVGFRSLGSIYREAYNELECADEAKSTEAINDVVDKYNDYWEIININGELELVELYDIYTDFANENQLYVVGNQIHKVFEGKKISCNINKTDQLMSLTKSSKVPSDDFYVTNVVNLKTACGVLEEDVDNRKSKCKDKRRASGKMSYIVEPYIDNGINRIGHELHMEGWTSRQGYLACFWYKYAGTWTVKDRSYQITYADITETSGNYSWNYTTEAGTFASTTRTGHTTLVYAVHDTYYPNLAVSFPNSEFQKGKFTITGNDTGGYSDFISCGY